MRVIPRTSVVCGDDHPGQGYSARYRNNLCVARMCIEPGDQCEQLCVYYMEYTIEDAANGEVSEACVVLSCVLVWDSGTNVDSSHNELRICESREIAT